MDRPLLSLSTPIDPPKNFDIPKLVREELLVCTAWAMTCYSMYPVALFLSKSLGISLDLCNYVVCFICCYVIGILRYDVFLNPAVALSYATRRLISRQLLLLISAVDIIAHFLGYVIMQFLLPEEFMAPPEIISDSLGMTRAIIIEIVVTALFTGSVLYAEKFLRPNVGDVFVPGIIVVCMVVGYETTACMNPAVAFPAFFLSGKAFSANHVVFWIGPLIGAFVGGSVVQLYSAYVHRKDKIF